MLGSPMVRRPLPALLLALLIESSAAAATFTVNSTFDNDDGLCNIAHCSFREAINAANGTPGLDTIRFVIGFGPKTIAPLSPLPTITEAVTIDGTTQPGFSGAPIVELDGSNAGPGAIGLRISAGASLVTGLVINRFQTAFPALGGHGILLEAAGGNEVRGNYIGTDMTGTAAFGNGGDGIQISSSAGNLIGRTSLSFRINVISGNGTNGVRILGFGSDNNIVAGNRIGTNANGTADLGNFINGVAVAAGLDNIIGSDNFGDTLLSGNGGDGVAITGATGTVVKGCYVGTDASGQVPVGNDGQGVQIGGANGNTVGPSNVISGNLASGVLLISGATGNTVAGNFVGTNATGTSALGNALNGVIASGANNNIIGPANLISGNGTNGVRIRSGAGGNTVRGNQIGVNFAITAAVANTEDGVELNDGAAGNTVGGPGADRNVISGNLGNGVLIVDATTTGNIIQGNFVGSNATASAAIPNGGQGIDIQLGASSNTVGGTAPGTKNVLSFNLGRGVFVESGSGNAILGNTISFNGSLGIDLAPAGVTPNDTDDPDPGPNLLQNFPVLTGILLGVSSTQIQGSLNSAAGSIYRVEFFSSGVCDGSGNGEGQTLLGSTDATTDVGGDVLFDVPLAIPALGAWITATATDPAGNTSEFSVCLPVPPPIVSAISPTSGPAGGGTPVVITGLNFQAPAAVTIGGAAATLVSVVSSAEIVAVTPALGPGTLNDVRVTNPSGLAGTLGGGWLADFTDVPGSHGFHAFIETIFRAGITAGCWSGNFCPDTPVSRAQMAVFLLKAKHGAAYNPPAATGLVFGDVDIGDFAAEWIEQLVAENITGGCGNGNYCPTADVTRAEMAVLLLKTKIGAGYVPPGATGLVFDDVEILDFAADWIEDLFARGITNGCNTNPPLYCPGSPNTRGQMAVFLVKTFGF